MNVLTIISKDLRKASTLFRVAQYLDFFKGRGLEFQFVNRKSLSGRDLAAVRSCDVLLNQKCLFNYLLAKKMIKQSRRTVFDFDDAIFTRPGKREFILTKLRVNLRLNLWLKSSDAVTVPNEYLAGHAEKFSPSVRVVPMAVDLDVWRPRRKNKIPDGKVIVGWVGAPVNIPLLERLDPVLVEVKKRCPQIRFAVFSGKKPNLSVPIDYHPFEPGKEAEFIQKLDIGLLPLQNDAFSKGKSPIKAIQYLACGVPVVGNVFGATAEILNDKNAVAVNSRRQWVEALASLAKNPEQRLSMGKAGRMQAEKNHDIIKTRETFLDILCGN